jgi:hypothetical protein
MHTKSDFTMVMYVYMQDSSHPSVLSQLRRTNYYNNEHEDPTTAKLLPPFEVPELQITPSQGSNSAV